MSTVSKPSAAFTVVERFRQDECKLSFLFYTDQTPVSQNGIEFEFTLSDSTSVLVKKANADITRPQPYKLEVLLTDADKAKLGPKRFTFRLYNKSNQRTVIEGAFAFIKQISRTSNGPVNPPDILIRYSSATSGVVIESLSVVQGIPGIQGPIGPAGPITNTVKEIVSRNLFNPNDSAIQYDKALYANTSDPSSVGNIISAAGYAISGYMAVTPGEQYTFSGVGNVKAVQFADANKVKLSGQALNAGTTTITIPANCYFILYTIKAIGDATIPATFQLEKGSAATAYEAYKVAVKAIDNITLKAEMIADNAKIANVGSELSSVVNRQAALALMPQFSKKLGKNLFNRDVYTIDKAVLASGDFSASAGYWISDYIAVSANTQYTLSYTGFNKNVGFYDANKAKISGQALNSGSVAITTITTPTSCAFICLTVKINSENGIPANCQVEKGASSTAYEAYSQKIEKIDNLSVVATDLADNAKIAVVGSEPSSIVNRQAALALMPQFSKKLGKNLFNRDVYTVDKAVLNAGDIITSAGYWLSDYVAVSANTQYTLSQTGFNKVVGYYDANKVKLGGLTLNSGSSAVTTITTPDNCAFILFTVKIGSETVIPAAYQVEQGVSATAYEAYLQQVEKVDNVSLIASHLADNAKIAVVGNEPSSVLNRQAALALMQGNNTKASSRNLFNRNSPNIQQNKAVLNSGDIVTAANYALSDYIPVLPNTHYTISGSGYNKAIGYYDASKTKLGGATLNSGAAALTTITTPANCYFMLCTVKFSSETAIPANYQVELGALQTPYQDFFEYAKTVNGLELPPYFSASTTGLKLLIFGDSIATTKPEAGGSSSEWPAFIKIPFWSKIDTAATPGARIKDDPGVALTSRTCFSRQISYAVEQGFTPDVIGIFLGTNDFFAYNLGSYDTAMSKTTPESLDRSNIYEALRYAYWQITTLWPKAIVFHATPLQRADRTLEAAKPVNDAIKQMAANYCVRVIDAAIESGVIRQYEVNNANGRYLRDGLHPNSDGMLLLANYYMKKIIAGIV